MSSFPINAVDCEGHLKGPGNHLPNIQQDAGLAVTAFPSRAGARAESCPKWFCFGQFGKFDASYALVRAKTTANELKDLTCEITRRLKAGFQGDECLGHIPANRVGTRHNRRFGDAMEFDQNALQLEGAEPIIGALEHVVCAPNIGEVTIGVAVS